MNKEALTFENLSLTHLQRFLLFTFSLLVVSLGQPATCWWCGILTAGIGYAAFWRILLSLPFPRSRFLLSMLWFTLVQMVQLRWAISHPYLYIYAVWSLTSLIMGIQFAIVSLMISPKKLFQLRYNLAIAAAWVLMEWSRLFILSGSSWNPTGLALASSLFSMQFASLWGVYGLSFWVFLVNLFALRIWIIYKVESSSFEKITYGLIWATSFCLPFVLGGFQVSLHDKQLEKTETLTKGDNWALLVQTNFPVEEIIPFETPQDAINFVVEEWRHILTLLKPHVDKKNDLIVMPEYVVPFGTFFPVFKYETVKKSFENTFGPGVVSKLPPLSPHLASEVSTDKGKVWMVNNAYWGQAIANVLQANVIVGLEDHEQKEDASPSYYNAAYYFCPDAQTMERYEKRILVPVAEYIPFNFCRQWAETYGINGSFSCGTEAKVLNCGQIPLGISICYEETYGHLMRENRLLGANLLVNLTNDGWYPNSSLPRQHLEHARLRTVEMGIPLIRACNTGITGAVDSLGRDVALLGSERGDYQETTEAMRIPIPYYHYQTLYTHFGDIPIIGFSFLVLCFAFISYLYHPRKEK